MAMPRDLGIIDLALSVPTPERFRGFAPLLMDSESRGFRHPGSYMFKDVPQVAVDERFPAYLVAEMDRFGVERGLLPVNFEEPIGRLATELYPDRFLPSFEVDPNRGMEGVRDLQRAVSELGAVAATAIPCGYVPQVPINDKRFYPLYAKCVELDIPIFINAGVPGPRVPMHAQHVELLDEVCWFFPELRIVTRHGCEPWTDLAVKLMLRWPNLYYSTSAFAPRFYPRDVVDFANTRGAGKVLFAGYFPSGLSYERIFAELPDAPFRDHVWPAFLRENALAVLKLGDRASAPP